MSIKIGDTKIAGNLNYSIMETSHSTYQYRQLAPANGASSTITMTSAGNIQNMTFNIPVEVVNLGESYLEYDLKIAAQAAGVSTWIYKDVYGEYDNILYRDTGTMNIVNIKNANIYNHISNRLSTSPGELEFHDDLNGIVPTNASLSDVKSRRWDGSMCSLAFKEPQHLEVGTAPATAFSKKRKVYLKDLAKDSFFGMAKNILLPVETYLELSFSGRAIGFGNTSAVNPAAGVTTALTGDIQLSGVVLRLAVEQNQDIIKGLKEKLAAPTGMVLPIPWVTIHTLRGSNASTNFVYNQPLDAKTCGRKIKRIIYAPYLVVAGGADDHKRYDHSNLNTAPKIGTYRTELDSQKLQRDDTVVSTTKNDDYMLHKSLLRNTTYYNQDMYNFNWVHIDAFDYSSESNHNHQDASIYVDGYDLNKPVTWSFTALNSIAADTITNTLIILGIKTLAITSSSFAVK